MILYDDGVLVIIAILLILFWGDPDLYDRLMQRCG